MKLASSRHILFVVGMHRSGTSAFCAALQACGATFGSGLLESMEGVNELGFWESAEVVALNDRLLNRAGAQWYSVTSLQLNRNWTDPEFESEHAEARAVLQCGFGGGPLEVVKDPRLCITLPLWLYICQEIGVHASVCVMGRAPMEVALSLQKRDGFPLGYGMRLLRTYLRGIADSVPDNTLYATYEVLLDDPVRLMREIAIDLPITVSEQSLRSALHRDMRNQIAEPDTVLPSLSDYASIDFQALDAEIQSLYPVAQTLSDLVGIVVYRGRELTRIGEAHTKALAALDDRDVDIDGLAAKLNHAVAMVAERDVDIDGLAAKLNHAVAMVAERDAAIAERQAHLQNIFRIPGLGLIFRAMWKYETR